MSEKYFINFSSPVHVTPESVGVFEPGVFELNVFD
jgi:hypothetical protein